MARAQGARAQMALAFETVYGTAPASGYTRVPFASTTLGSEQPLISSELLGYGRDPTGADQGRGDRRRRCRGADRRRRLRLLAEGGLRRADHQRQPGPGRTSSAPGSWTLPSLSIETAMPEVPRFAMYSGCVLDQLSWQMQRSGLLDRHRQAGGAGRGCGDAPPPPAPRRAGAEALRPLQRHITRNGSALGNVVSAEITYANNLDRIETIRSDGHIDGADPSIAALTGRVEVRFADQVLVNQAIAGDPCELEFGYALPSGESFTFTVHAVYLPRPRIEIAGRRACRRPSTGRRRGTPAGPHVHRHTRQRHRGVLIPRELTADAGLRPKMMDGAAAQA